MSREPRFASTFLSSSPTCPATQYGLCAPEAARANLNVSLPGWPESLPVTAIVPCQARPPRLVRKRIWDERLADIAHFEDYLTRQGTKILKFFLHVSRKEQKKRFLDRLEEPEKNWKFSASDVEERKFWGDYMDAFEEAIRATASKHAPWFIVPADNKWFTRLVVAAAIVDAMESLGLAYPKVDAAKKKEFAAARAALSREK